MKLGFSTLACPQWEINQIVETARANGYDGIELRAYKGSLDLLKAIGDFPGGPVEFRRRLSRFGLEVCCLDSSIALTDPDPAIFEGERMIDLAMALGAPYIRVFGGQIPAGEPREVCLSRAAGKLSQLARKAAQRAKRVLVETHDAFSTGDDLTDLMRTAESDDGTGVLWDLHNPYRVGESPQRTASLLANLTYHTHVKDGKKDAGYTFLGEGDVPLPELVSALHAAGYRGYLCLEWEKLWHPDLPEPEVALPQAARYLSDLLAKLNIPRG